MNDGKLRAEALQAVGQHVPGSFGGHVQHTRALQVVTLLELLQKTFGDEPLGYDIDSDPSLEQRTRGRRSNSRDPQSRERACIMTPPEELFPENRDSVLAREHQPVEFGEPLHDVTQRRKIEARDLSGRHLNHFRAELGELVGQRSGLRGRSCNDDAATEQRARFEPAYLVAQNHGPANYSYDGC